jgi:thioredoxin-related protein
MRQLLAALVVFSCSAVLSAAEGGWTSDYQAALKAAKEQKKVVLADFTGSDWCGWCIKLKKEVFDTKEFQEWAATNVVLLEVDFPQAKKLDDATKKQNEELAKRFSIEGFPTVLILDSTGKQVGANLGYQDGGPAAWIKTAEAEIKKAK